MSVVLSEPECPLNCDYRCHLGRAECPARKAAESKDRDGIGRETYITCAAAVALPFAAFVAVLVFLSRLS